MLLDFEPMGSKTEAIREKEFAETLMRNQDFDEARERLLRARTLFPKLENIDAMITVCNILSAAHSQPDLAINWYWVLQTHPQAQHSQIVSKYQMLTNSLQPIKNDRFPCTDSALVLLQNAFSVLSDKKKRLAFDLRRFTDLDTPQNVTGGNVGRPSGGCGFGHGNTSDAVYYDFSSNRKREVFVVGQIWAANDDEAMPRRYAKINWIIRGELLPFEVGVTWLEPIPGNMDEKRWCDVGLPVVCGGFSLKGSKMVLNEPTIFSHVVSRIQGLNLDKVEICPKKGEVWAVYEDWNPYAWCQDPTTRRASRQFLVEILTGYSKHEGVTVARLVKVPGLTSTFQRCTHTGEGSAFTIPANHLLRISHNVPSYRFKGGEIGGVSDGMFELDPLCLSKDMVVDIAKSSKEKSASDCSSFTDQASASSVVDLDPEIIEAKCKWSRSDFTKNQVWAVYDVPDSMPQRYVVVNNVISDTEVCTVFLEPHPKFEDEIYWVGENLPFVCGLFEAGRTTIMRMSQFSHIVTCELNMEKSLYRIYPRKGEIWAMYKNWNSRWKNCDYQCHQCQIVEVLSDFSEGCDIKIASLVEVDDCMTFFQRQVCNGFELIRMIPRVEMLSFSHQIPCFVVPRIEGHGFPKGSLHIESDALPRRHTNISCRKTLFPLEAGV